MALGKQKLEPIKHEKARLATFKKRKISLMKKAWEFKTLCDVEVCMIIYGPKLKDQPMKPETWASEEGKVTSIINKYKKITGKGGHQHRICSSSEFYDKKKRKVDDEAAQVRKSNRRLEYATWDQRFDSFSEDQLKRILGRVDAKLEVAGRKLEMMKADQSIREKTTSEMSDDSQYRHNLSNRDVDFHQQSEGNSFDNQQPINFQPNNQFHQMPASYSSFMPTPAWMRLNGNNFYQSNGASSSTIPYTPLRGPVHWTLQPSGYVPIMEPLSKPMQFPMMSSVASEENGSQVNEYRDFLKLQPPGDKNERS